VRSLLDTSVAIAGSSRLPVDAAISVITFGELRAGVLLADDPAERAARERRLRALQSAFVTLDVDSRVADRYGEIRAFVRRAGRLSDAADLLIVATAAAHGRTLHTLDDKQGRLAADLGVVVEYG
jgi:predicted nucleic acid-binding protein